MELMGKFFIHGDIKTITGLHIGGQKETLDIGGVDNPIIRDGKGRIYIPGSSLKGKIRCLLERKYSTKKTKKEGDPCGCGECPICKIFGPHSDDVKEPSRIIIRDSYLLDDAKTTEIKSENIIDRISGKALHPRDTERVPTDSRFKFEVIFNIYDENADIELIKKFIEGMELLEDDYLGGSGSRGYGKIKFEDISLSYKKKEYYEGDETKKMNIPDIKGIKELREKLNELKFS
ncbi:MAG: type III-A CRISPR-associated RAMP protein Csm3 [Candidatus Altiarchaeota archaeon]